MNKKVISKLGEVIEVLDSFKHDRRTSNLIERIDTIMNKFKEALEEMLNETHD